MDLEWMKLDGKSRVTRKPHKDSFSFPIDVLSFVIGIPELVRPGVYI